MILVTRKEHFSASHMLYNLNLDKDNNESLFGKCNNVHGHNYYLEVTLSGEVDPTSGYLVDLKLLKGIILSEIVEKVDHKNLNELDIFKNINPTTENIAKIFWNILFEKLIFPNARLYSVKLYETDKNFVEIRNDS
jgi:6-pyruvoyltetrahydropterin/6-carboxytetrahydropterin synthase